MKKNMFAIMVMVVMAAVNAEAFDFEMEEYDGSVEEQLIKAFQISLLEDCLQTKQIKNKDNVYESNPILGKKPGSLETFIYFGSCMYVFPKVIGMIPSKSVRVASFLAGTVLESYLIMKNNPELGLKGNNIYIQITVPFPF